MPLRVLLLELWYLCQEFERHRPGCQLPSGMAFFGQEQQPSYPCRLDGFSSLPQQKTMKPFWSFALCIYARWFDCLLCSGANRSWQDSRLFPQFWWTTEGHLQSLIHIFTVFFSCPKLYTSALVAILYTFVTVTTPAVIVPALSWHPLVHTKKKEMEP